MPDKQQLYDKDDLIRNWVLSDPLNFTRYFFKATHAGVKYIVGPHHRLICKKLDDVLRGKLLFLIINIAPRYGKTEVAVKNLIAMGLTLNPAAKFIHLSYSANLAKENSMAVKDIINCDEYKRLFPGTAIAYGRDTKAQWSTTAGGGVYAASSLGQVTGFGAGDIGSPEDDLENVLKEIEEKDSGGAIVIDDPIKPDDALSDNIRNQVNMHFETTIRNRVNSRRTPIIIIMQRLHEQDLCGYLMGIEPDKWSVLSIPCISYDENGEEQALWPFKHSLAELHNIEMANSFVFQTQYMQNPKPLEGLMYERFKTYETLPVEPGIRKNYTDTADKGEDFLCSVCYYETATAMYVTDILYTQKPMTYTEPETARMLVANNTRVAYIEGNNGGEGFQRNVEKNVRMLGDRQMMFHSFYQSANKDTRILTRSAEVQNLIYFPANWELRWPTFASAVKGFRKEGRKTHDDAPDVLTGMCEYFKRNINTPMKAKVTKRSI